MRMLSLYYFAVKPFAARACLKLPMRGGDEGKIKNVSGMRALLNMAPHEELLSA